MILCNCCVFFYLWYCIYKKIFAKWSDVNFDSEEVSRFRMVRLNVRFSIIYSQSKYYVSLRLKMHFLNKDIIGKHNSQIKRWKLELIVCCDFYLTYYLWQLQVTMFLVPMIFDRGTQGIAKSVLSSCFKKIFETNLK